jgi:hypothetical protein
MAAPLVGHCSASTNQVLICGFRLISSAVPFSPARLRMEMKVVFRSGCKSMTVWSCRFSASPGGGFKSSSDAQAPAQAPIAKRHAPTQNLRRSNTAIPYRPWKHSRTAYRELVPISPKTTPRAARDKRNRPAGSRAGPCVSFWGFLSCHMACPGLRRRSTRDFRAIGKIRLKIYIGDRFAIRRRGERPRRWELFLASK